MRQRCPSLGLRCCLHHPLPSPRRACVHHLAQMKADGEKWSMLTAYDYSTARIFDDAGIPVLLVGDSAANVVYGYDTTIPVTLDEMIPLIRGVVRGARTHWSSPTSRSAAEAGAAGPRIVDPHFRRRPAHAVKLEGGERVADQIATLTAAGIPVVAHRFHPQSVNGLGGFPRPGPRRRRRPAHRRRHRRPGSRRDRRRHGRWCPPTSPARSPAN